MKNYVPILPVFFLTTVMTFPRAFTEIKIALLVAMMLHFLTLCMKQTIYTSRDINWFYFAFIIVGCIAGLTGVLRENPNLAIINGLRLYILWSILILFILTYIRQFNASLIIHYSILTSAVTISAINITQIASSYFSIPFFPDWFREEMLMRVGFHYGYVQMTAHNIGMLLFIVPYLLVTVMRFDGRQEIRWLVWFALGVSLLTAALSGRRALWIVISLAPFIMWAIAIASGTQWRIRLYPVFVGLVTSGLLVALMAPSILLPDYTLRHIAEAFSYDDERSIQKYFLLDGFLSMPFIGSGFGGFAGYLRSYDTPWSYELSYHQALFNFGIIGSSILLVAIAHAFFKALKTMKMESSYTSNGALAILIGVLCLLIGSYSNPYLGSFDFLIILGFLPLIGSMKTSKEIESPRC